MTQDTEKAPVFIIAEAGSNWRVGSPQRDMLMAKTLIDAAVDAGADAVKFQTFRAETVYVENAGMVEYLSDTGIAEDIREIFRDLAMPYEMLPELHTYCKGQGIQFMSSPFSREDFDAVDPFVDIHKIASYEISHLRLLEMAARTKKPVLLSTGASVEDDIAWAIDRFVQCGGGDLTLMQCTLKYPTPPDSVNLRVLSWLKKRFGLPVGLSDHSRDPIVAPVAAVALGATVIEKHFTVHNSLPGPDHFFAITSKELKEMVHAIRSAEQMLGDGSKNVQNAEQEMYDFGRRRVQAVCDINCGEILREGVNIDIMRPGNQRQGVHPRNLEQIEGRTAARSIPVGCGIQEGDWSDGDLSDT